MSGQQMITFDYRLDEGEFAALTEKLNELAGSKARTHIARALNKTATTARVKLANKARESYTVKSRGFKGDMQIKKASAGNTVAIIRSQGSPLSMKEFKYSFSRPNPVRADIVQTGFKNVVKYGNKAFRGTGRLGGNVYVRTGKPAKRYKGIGLERYKKAGKSIPKSREALEKLFSKSVPYMLGSHRVWMPSSLEIQSALKRYMEQQIKQLLG